MGFYSRISADYTFGMLYGRGSTRSKYASKMNNLRFQLHNQNLNQFYFIF